jgi:hypothetical protein
MTENMLTINKKSMKMPKGAIRIGKSKQDTYLQLPKGQEQRQKDKQNTSRKTKDRAILSQLKSRMNSDTQEG